MIEEKPRVPNSPMSAAPIYRLVGPNGEFGGLFSSAVQAGEAARRAWPGVEQKDTEDAPGWDVEVVR